MKSPESMVKLVEELRKLPGVGPKTAGRLALYIIGMDSEFSHRPCGCDGSSQAEDARMSALLQPD